MLRIGLLSISFIFIFNACNSNEKKQGIKNEKELKMKEDFNDKVESYSDDFFNIDYPDGLRKYSEAEKFKKYPSTNRPNIVHGNEDLSVTVGISLNVDEVSQDEIPMFVKSIKDGFINNTTIELISDEIKVIDNHNFGVLRFFSFSDEGRIYNLMCGVSHNNKLVMVTFNCLESKMKTWSDEFEESLESIYFE